MGIARVALTPAGSTFEHTGVLTMSHSLGFSEAMLTPVIRSWRTRSARRASPRTTSGLAIRPRPSGSIRRAALVLVALAVAVAGGWALLTPRDTSPAGLNDAVDVSGGWMRVDNVLDVDLSTPMTGPGMAMGASSGVPEIPEGLRRIDVEISLAATSGEGLRFKPSAFTADTVGSDPVRPVAADDTTDLVPPNGLLTRTLSFQVPADATLVTLRKKGADRSVDFPLGPAPAAHGH
jgi:hypothetical protein